MEPAITASEARKGLLPLVKQADEDRDTIEIMSEAGNAVLMSEEEHDSSMTTVELLSGPGGARLRRSIRELESGHGIERELIE